MDTELDYGFDLAARSNSILSLLENNLQHTHEIINTLERKAQSNFTVISAIGVAAALVNINIISIVDLEFFGRLALVGFVIAYAFVAGLSLGILWPRYFDQRPLASTKENIDKVINLDDEEYLLEMISQYTEINKCHDSVMAEKSKRLLCSYKLTLVAICLVLLEFAVYFIK